MAGREIRPTRMPPLQAVASERICAGYRHAATVLATSSPYQDDTIKVIPWGTWTR
jgi:hypothetical protein